MLLVALLASTCIPLMNAYAKDDLRFMLMPITPSTQVDADVGWFDLLLAPGVTETVYINVTNISDRDITVEASLSPATTNMAGSVEYTPNDIPPDETLLHNLADIATVPETLFIPQGGQTLLPIEINMPEAEFQGMIAGGITVQEVESEEEVVDQGTPGMGVENEVRKTVAMIIRNDLATVAPDVNLTSAWPELFNYRNAFFAAIQNPEPRFIGSATVEAYVTEMGSAEVLFSEASVSEAVQFAPNTTMNFPIVIEEVEFVPGWYTMHVMVSGAGEVWELSYDFYISQADADALNDANILIENEFPWLMIIIGLLILALILIIFLILLLKRRKKKKNDSKGDDDYYYDEETGHRYYLGDEDDD